jgi:hypothetical protein
MQNAPDNKTFPPSYRKLWPTATKAFALEEAEALAYASEPTPERLMALQQARAAYSAACLVDAREQFQAVVHREAAIQGAKPEFPIPAKRVSVKCG